jgi:hypothetical protein
LKHRIKNGERVRKHFLLFQANQVFESQPCISYGGGALLPYEDLAMYNQIKIYDGGVRNPFAQTNEVFLYRDSVNNYSQNLQIEPEKN